MMVKAEEVLKRSDIRSVLGILTEGMPDHRFKKMAGRYYALYCCLLESWSFDHPAEIVVTDFQRENRKAAKDDYYFYGKAACGDWNKETEKRLNLCEIFKHGDFLLFPECFADGISDEWLSAEILRQVEKGWEPEIPIRMNQKLFLSVKENCQSRKSSRKAIRKSMERVIHDQIDRRIVENAFAEYMESRVMVCKWGKLLKKNDDRQLRYILMDDRSPGILKSRLKHCKSEDSMGGVCRWFLEQDQDNPPDPVRCLKRKAVLAEVYGRIGLSDYLAVTEEHKRILIERNAASAAFPVIYIRDQYGNRTHIGEEDVSTLLCMDIYVMDSDITSTDQILAYMLFYLEYPIRTERFQRESLESSLVGMFSISVAGQRRIFRRFWTIILFSAGQ